MKTIHRVLTLAFTLALAVTLQAQTPPADLTPIAASAIPPTLHSYFSLQRPFQQPPMPFNWLSEEPDVVLYVSPSHRTNAVWVGDQNINYAQRAAEAQVLRLATVAAENDGPPTPGDGGGGGGGTGGGGWSGPTWATNDFHLEAVYVASNLFQAVLFNTTNGSTYLALSTENLDPANNNTWLVEGSFQGSESNSTSFTLGVASRTNSLFLRVRTCDEQCAASNLPLSWELDNFGITGVPPDGDGGDWDGDGVSNLAEYLAGTDPNSLAFAIRLGYQTFNSSEGSAQFEVLAGVPAYSAVLVNPTNLSSAVWTPYTGSAVFTLGPTDGVYSVQFGLRGRGSVSEAVWQGTSVVLGRTAPEIHITSPVTSTVAKPVIQVQGFCPEPLWSVSYSISNALGVFTNLDGLLVTGYGQPTNAFTLFDVQLTNGLNLITLAVQNSSGNFSVTNLQYTLDYADATNAPGLQVFWPQDGGSVSGTSFTLRGHLDDETASITLQSVGASGQTNTIAGVVERNGAVWVDAVPLEPGTNFLALTAINAAGISSTSNLMVLQSAVTLTIDEVPGDQLNHREVTVSGTISDTGYKVWVNGRAAVLTGNAWTATHVPVTPGGSAVFAAIAIPLSDHEGNGTPPASPLADPATSNPSSANSAAAALQPEKAAEIKRVYGEWWGQSSGSFVSNALSGSFLGSWWQTETNADAHASATASEFGVSVANGMRYTESFGDHLLEEWQDNPTNVVYSSTELTPDDGLLMNAGIFSWDGFEPMANWVYGAASSSAVVPAGNDKIRIETGAVARDTRVVLRTGGRSGLMGQSLFVLTGSAWDKTKANGPQVPKQQLWVPGLGKYLGSDGLAYAALPDNAEVLVTLQAPVPYYGFQVNATKHKPHITANNLDLRTNTPEFCVGQYVSFAPAWSLDSQYDGAPSGVVSNSYRWVISSKFVNHQWQLYTSGGESGGVIYYGSINYDVDYDGLKVASPGVWYVSGGAKTAVLNLKLYFSNDRTVKLTTSGKFNIFRPTVTCTETPHGAVGVDTRSTPEIFLGLGDSTASTDFS